MTDSLRDSVPSAPDEQAMNDSQLPLDAEAHAPNELETSHHAPLNAASTENPIGDSADAPSVVERDDDDDDTELPPWQRVVLTIGSLAMAYFAQVNLFRDPPEAVYSGYMVIYGLGILNFFINIFGLLRTTILQDGGSFGRVAKGQVQRFRVSVVWVVVSVAIMAYLAWRTVQRPPESYFWEHVILSVLGMAALFIAIRISKKSPKVVDDLPFVRWEIIVMVALVGAALLIRGVNVDTMPYMLDQDEGAFAREGGVLAILENYRTSPFEIGTYSYTRWHQVLLGLSADLFGVSKGAARLPSVIMGSFTVLALYLLGRELYGRKVALVAAMFMLAWVFHAHFSRLALNQPGDPLFATLAVYFLLRGLRLRTAINYYYSGLFLGIAQFFYLGARLAPIVIVLYLGFLFIRQRSLILAQWKLLLLVPLTAFIMTMPQNYFLYYYKEPFTTRFDKSIFNDSFPAAVNSGTVGDFMRRQFVFSFTAFITSSDRGGWYGVGSNLMGPFGAPFFVIGALATLLLFWARPKWVLPLAWGLGVVLGGAVINNSPPAYERYHPGVSAFALLVAFGVWVVAEGVMGLLNRRQRVTPLLMGLGAALFVGNLAFYLIDYIPMRNYFNNRPNWLTNRVSTEAVGAHNAGRRVVLLGGYETGVDETNVLRYFMVDKPYLFVPGKFPEELPDPRFTYKDGTIPTTYIVAPSRVADLDRLREMLPNGTTRTVELSEDKTVAFYVYEVGDGGAVTQTGRR
jgi:hypothetical protein